MHIHSQTGVGFSSHSRCDRSAGKNKSCVWDGRLKPWIHFCIKVCFQIESKSPKQWNTFALIQRAGKLKLIYSKAGLGRVHGYPFWICWYFKAWWLDAVFLGEGKALAMQEKDQDILQGIPYSSFPLLQDSEGYINRNSSIVSQGTSEKPALLPWLSLDFPWCGWLKRKKRAEAV